eukprot:TRINITY_DN67889_c11_g1_i1.p1 TRINITY_DN67889_c11_g1~~TRINITY_DN67889_c11_g1_i1.p1  ORF type:complete len:212 (+),score=48.34 TRINITY_DN67889_c11_g1_i1:30-638(+)
MDQLWRLQQQQQIQQQMAVAQVQAQQPKAMLPPHMMPAEAYVNPVDQKYLQELERKGKRKAAHNEVEKRRRTRIKNNLQELQALFPTCTNITKADTTDAAVEYIKYLQSTLRIQTTANKQLQEENAAMKEELARHRDEFLIPPPNENDDQNPATAPTTTAAQPTTNPPLSTSSTTSSSSSSSTSSVVVDDGTTSVSPTTSVL